MENDSSGDGGRKGCCPNASSIPSSIWQRSWRGAEFQQTEKEVWSRTIFPAMHPSTLKPLANPDLWHSFRDILNHGCCSLMMAHHATMQFWQRTGTLGGIFLLEGWPGQSLDLNQNWECFGTHEKRDFEEERDNDWGYQNDLQEHFEVTYTPVPVRSLCVDAKQNGALHHGKWGIFQVQLRPTIPDVKGPTTFICYWQIFVIANKGN